MCGFEILLSQVQDSESRREKEWNQYHSSLQKKGYFKVIIYLSCEETVSKRLIRICQT